MNCQLPCSCFFVILGIATANFAQAAPSDLDLTWGGTGFVEKIIGSSELIASPSFSWITDAPMAIQPDGKVVVCSHAFTGNNSDWAISRYNNDATPDTGFGNAGVVIIDVTGAVSYDWCTALRVQADGTILVLGKYIPNSTADNAPANTALLRLTATGQRDASFGANGLVLIPRTLGFQGSQPIVLPDGRIAIAGSSTDGTNSPVLARLNPDGTTDTSLAPGGFIAYAVPGGMLVDGFLRQADGKLVISGKLLGATAGVTLLRLNNDGSPDANFGIGGRVATSLALGGMGNLAVQSDGKLIVVTTSTDFKSLVLLRYLPNGTQDTAFGNAGFATASIAMNLGFLGSMTVQQNDKIVVGGGVFKSAGSQTGDTEDLALARFLPDGTLDPSFGNGGLQVSNLGNTETVSWVALQPDGKIVVAGRALNWAGSSGTVSLVLARYQGDPTTIPTVVEYYNPDLDNFFITADPTEQAFVDSGAVGRWQRTGNTFKAGGANLVCRFGGNSAINPATGIFFGPNSHFYTADFAECAGLKAIFDPAAKSWRFESNDFAITPAINGACSFNLVPIFRAYNNGFTRGIDSNHRITSNPAAIEEVVTRGWINEGVVMCAPVSTISPPPTFTLTVTKAGDGSGTVTASPTGISCGATCFATYASATFVTLTATPAAGSTFSGWSGACAGTGSCIVTMDAAKAVTATFALTFPFHGSVAGNWSGSCGSFPIAGDFSASISANGTVSGSFSGSDSGLISGNVTSTGVFSATATGSAGIYSWSGQVTPSGNSLSASGSFSGGGCSGTWSGSGPASS